MLPKAVEKILDYCKQKINRFHECNDTGLIEIRCCPYQSHYKVECRCGDFQDFPIAPEDLDVWETPALPRQRETLETLEQVLAKLNSALFETFCLQQGYATITIVHRGHDGRYGFQLLLSVVHGLKP
ncbi:hypothetical protein NUACC21_46670 [Scytonema sp. NUACC21]